MIAKFNQTGRQPNPEYEGIQNEKQVVKAFGSTRKHDAYLECNGEKIMLASKLHRERIGEKKVGQVTDILSDGKRIGYIYPDLVAKHKFWIFSIGWSYFSYCFKNKNYLVYEVCRGKNENFICVYENDVTVAIIQKDDVVKNYRDYYTIYAENNVDLTALYVLALYVDCILYPDIGEVCGAAETSTASLTIQPELLAKYDETFIPRIKRMDGLE